MIVAASFSGEYGTRRTLKIVADYLGTYISADFVHEFHGIADAPFHIIYIDGETVNVHFHYTDIEDYFQCSGGFQSAEMQVLSLFFLWKLRRGMLEALMW